MSNSKLSSYDNDYRRQMREALAAAGGHVVFFRDVGITVVLCPEFPGSRMMSVSMSHASPDEQKIRRKVGEFCALQDWDNGESVKVSTLFIEVDDSDDAEFNRTESGNFASRLVSVTEGYHPGDHEVR